MNAKPNPSCEMRTEPPTNSSAWQNWRPPARPWLVTVVVVLLLGWIAFLAAMAWHSQQSS